MCILAALSELSSHLEKILVLKKGEKKTQPTQLKISVYLR